MEMFSSRGDFDIRKKSLACSTIPLHLLFFLPIAQVFPALKARND